MICRNAACSALRNQLVLPLCFVVVASICGQLFAEESIPAILPDGDRWKFAWPQLEGVISGGHEHGITLTKGSDGQPVTRSMCLNLEHYLTKGRFAHLVPRNQAPVKCQQLDAHSVLIEIEQIPDWPVAASITYRLRAEMTIEAEYELTFHGDLVGFEALVSNYFHEPTEPYVSLGNDWVQPRVTEREHRFIARSTADIVNLIDGRYTSRGDIFDKDFCWTVELRNFSQPVMISPIRDTGWSVVHLFCREDCTSLSLNRAFHAHDLSFVGRDVAKGDTVRWQVRMIYVKLNHPAEALRLQEVVKSP